MSWHDASRVLAVGIDAAEPSFIRQLIEHDQMPVLKSLMLQGKWLRVESPAHIGSGSVWPTFITGEEPAKHGVYGEWCWRPETMRLSRNAGRHLKPFWKALAEDGMRIGILDVPFAPFLGFTDGFEISEWGPHDLLEGRLQIAPDRIIDLVTKQVPVHPMLLDRLDTMGPRDYHGLKRLSSGCLDGIRLRGALAQRLLAETDPHLSLIVFTEIHHSAHYMWHTVAADDSIYKQDFFRNLDITEPTLGAIYHEVDNQIGRLLETVRPETTVFVFSLHGMRPTHGVPALIEPLLCELGYARRAGWRSQSWTERAIALMAAAKLHTPKALKRVYYKSLPTTATLRLARPTMMPVYDWQHTRAFALPTDQHGWIQVNLRGREANGIVSVAEYEHTCHELEEIFRTLTASDGKPLVREVFRTAKNAQEALVQRLPDLILHWAEPAFSAALRITGSSLQMEPVGQKFTGQHALDGFCIVNKPDDLCEGETLSAAEMHSLIKRVLEDRSTPRLNLSIS